MKANIKSQTPKKDIQFNQNKNRPEIRDDLDSRVNEEQDIKGDDTTHNRKSPRKGQKKKNRDF
jgi:hypothetical protein